MAAGAVSPGMPARSSSLNSLTQFHAPEDACESLRHELAKLYPTVPEDERAVRTPCMHEAAEHRGTGLRGSERGRQTNWWKRERDRDRARAQREKKHTERRRTRM